ncbi:MAG TPA: hypothetical protein VKA64_02205 [Gammaproteobacteria bacterium]|nr:hypothetical protein [Gammaproteobacteria bacterium]
MTASPHLLVAVSGHGYGHLAQVAPVVAALRRQRPGLRLTVRTSLPPEVVERRIESPFALQAAADDFGMVQRSALDIDAAASAEAYRRFHGEWGRRVEATAAALEAAAPDVVLADVPYLTLAAARATGLPAVAMCSLNWLDIFHHYCGGEAGAEALEAVMTDAYAGAEVFLRPTPSMPMERLANTRAIGPVCAPGCNRRPEIAARLRLARDEKLVLVGMGGIEPALTLSHWPEVPGVRWVAPGLRRPDGVAMEDLNFSFSDVLASVDAVITKPGYGTFAEAAACGVPVAYVPRGDWPEEPYLVDWLATRGGCMPLAREAYATGQVMATLRPLLEQGPLPPVPPSGVEEAAVSLAAFF